MKHKPAQIVQKNKTKNPMKVRTTKPSPAKKSPQQLAQTRTKVGKAKADMIDAHDHVKTVLKEAIKDDLQFNDGKDAARLRSLYNDYVHLAGGDTYANKTEPSKNIDQQSRLNTSPYADNTKHIDDHFSRHQSSSEKKLKVPLRMLDNAAFFSALEDARKASLNYSQLRQELDADEANSQKILQDFDPKELMNYKDTKINWDATSFDDLLEGGTTIKTNYGSKITITPNGISQNYKSGDNLNAFAKLAMEWGKRHPGEKVALGGPPDGVLDTLKIMAETGRNDPNKVYKGGVKLKQSTVDDMNTKFKVSKWQLGSGFKNKAAQVYQSGGGLMTGPIASKMYNEQNAKVNAYVRMLNNIPNNQFADHSMTKGQLYAQTMINSYDQVTREQNVDPNKAKNGDVSKNIKSDLDLELNLVLDAQFKGTDIKDTVDLFKGLEGKPMNMTEDRFMKQMPNNKMRQEFQKALQADRSQTATKASTPSGPSMSSNQPKQPKQPKSPPPSTPAGMSKP